MNRHTDGCFYWFGLNLLSMRRCVNQQHALGWLIMQLCCRDAFLYWTSEYVVTEAEREPKALTLKLKLPCQFCMFNLACVSLWHALTLTSLHCLSSVSLQEGIRIYLFTFSVGVCVSICPCLWILGGRNTDYRIKLLCGSLFFLLLTLYVMYSIFTDFRQLGI